MSSALMDAVREYDQVFTNLVRLGAQGERDRLLPILSAIFSAYDRAASMPEAKIPSLLTAAIVTARMDIANDSALVERARKAGL